MQVDPDFEADGTGPVDGGIDVDGGAGGVGFVGIGFVGPEADGDAYGVEAGVGDFLEVVEGAPGVPVGTEDFKGGGGTEFLREGVFVDYAEGLVEGFEDGWRYPCF